VQNINTVVINQVANIKEKIIVTEFAGDSIFKIVEKGGKFQVLQDGKKIGEYIELSKAIKMQNQKAEPLRKNIPK